MPESKSFSNRRHFLKASALGTAGFLLLPDSLFAGLGSADRDASTLYIAAEKTAQTLDPDLVNSYLKWADFEANLNLYDRLVINATAPNATGVQEAVFNKYVGGLAESWEQSQDGRTWTFKLRQGVKSFRGNEMTAEDIKWGWDRSYALKDIGHWIGTKMMLVERQEDVRVVGRYAIEMRTKENNPDFLLSVFAQPAVFDTKEVKRHVTVDDAWARRWLAENDAGFGPYRVESFRPGKEIVFAANDNYYQGRPVLRRVVYLEVPDSSDRMQMVLGGEVDIAEWLTPKQRAIISRMGAACGAKILSARGTNYSLLGVNLNLKPFDDVRVRRAIAFAVPYQEIVDKVYYGAARRWRGFAPDIYPGYPDHHAYETDPNQARALLAEAGLAGGFRTTLHYSSRYLEEEEGTVNVLKDSLAELGIEVLLRRVTAEGMMELRHLTHDYQMYLYLNANLIPGPREQQNIYWGTASRYGGGENEKMISSEPKRPGNYSGILDPELLQLLEESEKTADIEKRYEIYNKIQEIALDKAYMIPLASVGLHLSVRNGISGWTAYTEQQMRFTDIKKRV